MGMKSGRGMFARCSTWRLCAAVAFAAVSGALSSAFGAIDGQQRLQIPVIAGEIPIQQIIWRPRQGTSDVVHFDPRGCPIVEDSVANMFNSITQGSEITLQAGMVVNEGFGSSFIVPDPNPGTPENEAFPIEVTLVEFFVGTPATGIGAPIQMGYRIELWDGEPGVPGSFVAFSVTSGDPTAEPGVPPDVSLQRVTGVEPCNDINVLLGGAPASAGKVQFFVDDPDPTERMFIQGLSGTGRFTLMVYMTRAHTPGSTACTTLSPCNNAFFATEGTTVAGVSNPATPTFLTRNWLYGINCGSTACSDYKRFSELPTGLFGCRPSRDVLQQVQYRTSSCAAAPTGACCFPVGTCQIRTQSDCTTNAGSWQGQDTVCEPNNCPQPMGACCTNGQCSVTTNALCTAGGGTYQGTGTACTSVNCPTPTGACCTTTGGCAIVTQSQCVGLGGEYIGNNIACGPSNTCPKGACCLPNGSCQANVSQPACAAQGGVFQGVGTSCASVTCPQPDGACCSTTGSCVIVQQDLCVLFGGTWQGPMTACQASTCSDPVGACCNGANCSITTESQCAGTFLGADSLCLGWPSNPITCCPANISQSDGVDLADLLMFLESWLPALGTTTPGILADWNGDSVIDIADLLAFLEQWLPGCF